MGRIAPSFQIRTFGWVEWTNLSFSNILENPNQVGCIVLGPSGCGKTSVVKLVTSAMNRIPFFFDHEPNETKKISPFQRSIETVNSQIFSKGKRTVSILDDCSLDDNRLKRWVSPSLNMINQYGLKTFTKWVIIPDDDHQRHYEELKAMPCIVTIRFKAPNKFDIIRLTERMPQFENRGKFIHSYLSSNKIIDFRNFIITMWFKSIEASSSSLEEIETKTGFKDPIDHNFMILSNSFKNKNFSNKIATIMPEESIGFVHNNLLTVAECKYEKDRNRRGKMMDDIEDAFDHLSMADLCNEYSTTGRWTTLSHASHHIQASVDLVKTSFSFNDSKKYHILFNGQHFMDEESRKKSEELGNSYKSPYNTLISKK